MNLMNGGQRGQLSILPLLRRTHTHKITRISSCSSKDNLHLPAWLIRGKSLEGRGGRGTLGCWDEVMGHQEPLLEAG